MKVSQMVEALSLKVLCGIKYLDREITSGYCCDLLSRVMARGKKGMAWITVQTHINVVAVAALVDMACIIIPEGIEVDSKVLDKAEEEGVIMLSSDLTAFELSGKMYQMGIAAVCRDVD